MGALTTKEKGELVLVFPSAWFKGEKKVIRKFANTFRSILTTDKMKRLKVTQVQSPTLGALTPDKPFEAFKRMFVLYK